MAALLLLLCLLCGPLEALGKLVFTGVIPHGDFAYDPALVDNKNGSVELHEASKKFAEKLAEARPEVLLLSSPHGIYSSKEFLLYSNSQGSGYALIGQDLHDQARPPYAITMNLPLARPFALKLAEQLNNASVGNVSTLSGFGDQDDMPLRWGEVIPLSLLQPALQLDRLALLVLSQPGRRTTDIVPMIPELQRLGAALYTTLDQWPQRVAVVISADLAHTHQASGPYGYSPTAVLFDAACERWAKTLESKALTVDAAQYVQKALSCGYSGMVMLDGLLQAANRRWTPTLLASAHPTYYGMLVATMTPPRWF